MEIGVFCEHPFTRARVTSEGDVAMCCYMRRINDEPKENVFLGNLVDQTFDDIWFSEEAEEIRKQTKVGDLHPKCSRNDGCPFVCRTKPYTVKHVVYNEYPTSLEIDLPNTHCNVGGLRPGPSSPACIMCERSAPNFRPEKSSRFFDVLDKLQIVMPNLNHMHVQGIAEPFFETNQDQYMMFSILDHLKFDDHRDHIRLTTTTNGILLKPATRKKYLDRVPRSITTFSIDAASPETFKKIRVMPVFDKVVEHLLAFDQERDPTRQLIQIHNNINLYNLHEVVAMVRLAKRANVDVLEFNPTAGFRTDITVNEGNCGQFAKAQRDIETECERLGVTVRFYRPLDLGLSTKLDELTL